jgi:hypothetical protein
VWICLAFLRYSYLCFSSMFFALLVLLLRFACFVTFAHVLGLVDQIPESASPQAKEFLNACLVMDPAKRYALSLFLEAHFVVLLLLFFFRIVVVFDRTCFRLTSFFDSHVLAWCRQNCWSTSGCARTIWRTVSSMCWGTCFSTTLYKTSVRFKSA